MATISKYITQNVIFSIILLVVSFIIINISFSDISESVSVIKNSRAIQKNPNNLDYEISNLLERKNELQNMINRLEKLKYPTLELFTEIAKKNKIKLTGVSQKTGSLLSDKKSRNYQLIFSGSITSVLNTFDYIEKNLALIVESISVQSNDSNNKLVDLTLLIIIPESEDNDK